MVGTESLSLSIPVSMYLHTYKRNEWTNFIVKHTGFNLTWSTEKVRKISRIYLISYIVYTYYSACVLRSVQFSRSVVSDSLQPPWIAAHQASLSITNSRSSLKLMSIQWCHPAISSSVVPFSSGPQSLPASESFPMSQLFAWSGQSIGVSALASVLPMNTQDWSPLERTGWISLQSKGLSRVFSKTTVQKHQCFSAQPSSQSNSHIHTWPQEKPEPWLDGPWLAK